MPQLQFAGSGVQTLPPEREPLIHKTEPIRHPGTKPRLPGSNLSCHSHYAQASQSLQKACFFICKLKAITALRRRQ